MRFVTFAEAERIYACSVGFTLREHPVHCEKLRGFCKSLSALMRELGDLARDEYWRDFLWPLRRFRFGWCGAPLPFNWAAEQLAGMLAKLRIHLARRGQLYGHVGTSALDVLQTVEEMVGMADAPLLEVIQRIAANGSGEGMALVLSREDLVADTRAFIRTRYGCEALGAVAPRELTGSSCHATIAVVGSPRWFPAHVFDAPRARRVEVVCYDWLDSRHRSQPAFGDASSGPPVRSQSSPRDGALGFRAGLHTADEYLPKVDWSALAGTATARLPESEEDEVVEARLFLLAGGTAVLLPDGNDATVLVLDLGDERVMSRIPATDVARGMHVLVRTLGGGDYIIPVADRILGEECELARKRQTAWKSRLRAEVEASSLVDVAVRLLDLGSEIADEANVRHWMSGGSIKPRAREDFNAVMKLVGLEQEAEEHWQTARAIDSAHRRAGHHIRKLLLRQVAGCELSELVREGRQTFELAEADGGSLTAYRVDDISPDTVLAHSTQLGHPFDVEEELWRG